LRPAKVKVSETLFKKKQKTKNKLGVVVHACHPSSLGGKGRRVFLQPKQETPSKIQNQRKGLGRGSRAQHLPGGHKAQSSNPSEVK
jgi:hypothetical protein